MNTPVTHADPIPAGLSNRQLLDIYYYLLLTRTLEQRLVNLYRQGKVIGGLYRSLGQEGESVASAFALESGDVMAPLIRNLGSMLVMGARPVEILRQYMAKGSGPTRGREMNLHFNQLELGYLGQISAIGDMVPVMAGIALSFKMKKEPRVGLVYIGDGGTSTGAFHEGVNLAAVQRLPLVVIMEHNGYAYSTPTTSQTAVDRLAKKGFAYGIPAVSVNGNDVFAMYEATKQAVSSARQGGGVTLIEAVTYRRKGHAEHDDQGYQPIEEIQAWEKTDPLTLYETTIVERRWVKPLSLTVIRERVGQELDQAIAECENDPFPEPTAALGDVLKDGDTTAPLWFRRIDG